MKQCLKVKSFELEFFLPLNGQFSDATSKKQFSSSQNRKNSLKAWKEEKLKHTSASQERVSSI